MGLRLIFRKALKMPYLVGNNVTTVHYFIKYRSGFSEVNHFPLTLSIIDRFIVPGCLRTHPVGAVLTGHAD